MTFLNIIHSALTSASPLSLVLITVTYMLPLCCMVFTVAAGSVVVEIAAPAVPVTWEKALRARVNADNGLWSAVVACITNHHGEVVGEQWRTYRKIKVEKGSNGKFRAVSHGMAISLPDWQWTAK